MIIAEKNLKNALVLLKEKKYSSAKIAFLEIIKDSGENWAIYLYLYEVCKNLNDLNDAKKYLKKYLSYNPEDYINHNNLANLYLKTNKPREAEESYLQSLEIKNDYWNGIINLAIYYQGIGDIKKAKNFYYKAIKINPLSLGTYFNLSKIDKEFVDKKKIKFIKDLIKNKKITDFNLASGYFLLALDQKNKKDVNKEMENLTIAHKHLFNSNIKYNLQILNYWTNILPQKYKKIKYNSSQEIKKKTENLNPIFIVGLPRSGSTLIESIISSGPEKVSSAGESNLLNWALLNSHRSKMFKTNNNKNNQWIIDIDLVGKKFLDSLGNVIDLKYRNSNGQFFIEKSLENFFYIDLILEIFPKAKFVHAQRDIQDNIIAIFKEFLTNIAWSHNLENILKYIDNYLAIISFFKKKYPNKILSVKLDELTEKNIETSKEIYDFCNLEWSDKVLEFYKRTDLYSNTASNLQIRSGIKKYDYNKYQEYKKFIKKFSNDYTWIK